MLDDWFDRLFLRRRTGAVTLGVLAFAALLLAVSQAVFEFQRERDAALERLQAVATLVGTGSAGALQHRDAAGATRLLEGLTRDPALRDAMLLDGAGRRIARLSGDRQVALPEAAADTEAWLRSLVQAPRAAARFTTHGTVEVVEPVRVDGLPRGMVYLAADLGQLRRVLAWQLATTLLPGIAMLALVAVLARGVAALQAQLRSRDAELGDHRTTLEARVQARTVVLERTMDSMRLALQAAEAARRAAEGTSAPRAVEAVRRAPRSQASGLEGVRVLLVEDNVVNRDLASKLLAALGCEVSVAGNGAEALEQMQRGRLDVVLMDCQMPVMDGLEATAAWRARERAAGAPRLPIVALTASPMPGDRDACLEAGMDEHLAKPFDAGQLRAALLRLVQAAPTFESALRALPPAAAATGSTGVPSDAGEPVFEPESLSAISALDPDGHRGLVPRIVGLFVQDSARQIELLEAGLRAGDAASAGRAVHSLKSSAANVGGRALSHAAALAERRALAGDLAAVAAQLGALQALRAQTVAALAPLMPPDAA
jgi:CheY-like chemotaxis protein/HPt (histidine-containing phosphotransfer) domain-containing protein